MNGLTFYCPQCEALLQAPAQKNARMRCPHCRTIITTEQQRAATPTETEAPGGRRASTQEATESNAAHPPAWKWKNVWTHLRAPGILRMLFNTLEGLISGAIFWGVGACMGYIALKWWGAGDKWGALTKRPILVVLGALTGPIFLLLFGLTAVATPLLLLYVVCWAPYKMVQNMGRCPAHTYGGVLKQGVTHFRHLSPADLMWVLSFLLVGCWCFGALIAYYGGDWADLLRQLIFFWNQETAARL